MCGIFGVILKEGKAAPIIHAALKMLEYRGYDSAGEATIDAEQLYIKKDVGKIDEIHARVNLEDLPGRIGIGHTRWATHGAPSTVNAHPHTDCKRNIAIVHNGIIENYEELKEEMEERGHSFNSRTDSEVVVHLIEENIKKGKNYTEAFLDAIRRLEGSYAIVSIYSKEPDKVLGARNESPLILGLSDKEYSLASDISALVSLTNKIVEVSNGEIVEITDKGFEIRRIEDLALVTKKTKTIDWTVEAAHKSGFPHYMLKEIHDQPLTIRNAFYVQEKYLDLITNLLDRSKEIFLLASGTSHHSCLAASYILSQLARISAHPALASEFVEQFGNSIGVDSTVLSVSQSGETADVLKAVDHARFKAATVIGLTNTIGSTITRVTRAYLCQNSGCEVGVAATKTFTAQVMVLTRLALKLAKFRGKLSQDEIDTLHNNLAEIPDLARKVIETQEEKIKLMAKKYKDKSMFYFLGKGINVATAYEGRLKLLEVAYIPSIAYPAGEMKHGPISLAEKGFPVIFICPPGRSFKGIVGNVLEMQARGAEAIGIIEEKNNDAMDLFNDYIEIPAGVPELFSSILNIIPLQLFAYYMAVERQLDPDKPRNLAKSVTVL